MITKILAFTEARINLVDSGIVVDGVGRIDHALHLHLMQGKWNGSSIGESGTRVSDLVLEWCV